MKINRGRTQAHTAIFLMLFSLLVAGTGCLHRVGSTQPATALEKVFTYNAVIAETNNGIERGVELLPTSIIPTPAKTQVLGETRNIAVAHKQLTAILSKGRSAISTGDAAQIRALIQQIKDSANNVVSSGVVGIKNPNSQASFTDEAKGIANLADLLVTGLQSAGVLK